MELVGIAAVSLTAAFSALALKKYTPETAAVLAAGAGIVILTLILGRVTPVLNELKSFADSAGVSAGHVSVLIKTIGICFICRFASDACRDAGQSSLAAKVELAGKISVLFTALPLFQTILNTAAGLITNQ